MFDYEKFENQLYTAIETYVQNHQNQKEDIYIMSIYYWPDFTTFIGVAANTYSNLNEQTDPEDVEDYVYYKYCEEEWEWDLTGDFDVLSKDLQAYYEELEAEGAKDSNLRDEKEEMHREKIIAIGRRVLKKIQQTDAYKAYPKLYLNFYIREYFTRDESMEIFGELNGEESLEEYGLFWGDE